MTRALEFVEPNEARVAHLLTEGEDNGLEYKQAPTIPAPAARFVETAAAFANGVGGTILVGVGADGAVVGFDRAKAADMIVSIVRDHVQDACM